MDPTTALERIRSIVTAWDLTQASDVYEIFDALDAWLSRGGMLPADWQRNRT